ncbi:hypothetical protein QP968_05970 [Corynebacterium sp. MSK041]|uniref:DUF7373 family lipoprotein n=1 Tax=Corynebacterium sp. MSK041 TaxID=3050194 RepID=UPI00254D7D19|nr:hypothetical protein [Corynebacterium sp. MSK041]MDK8795255.1 hypothetical protein [Corynebacterium sp. MSK041]
MKKRTSLPLAAMLTATALLSTGCSVLDGIGKSGEAPSEPTSVEVAEPTGPEFDTGSYATEPHKGWPETNDEMGPSAEMALFANNTLLPYEVNNEFTRNAAHRRVWKLDNLSMDLPKVALDRLDPLGEKFLLGYAYLGNDASKSRSVGNFVLRFEDPESAQKAADALTETHLTEGSMYFFEGDPHNPGTEEPVAGHNDATAVRTADGEGLDAVKVHKEYLLMSTAYVDKSGDEGNDDAGPEATKWQGEYVSSFFSKQIPILDTLKTHKTAAGYGFSDEWPPLDPKHILQYTVLSPKDQSVQSLGGLPMALEPRGMAGRYKEVPEILSMIDQAKVEAMATMDTSLFRTKNPEGAKLILATMHAVTADLDYEPWDAPQEVPGMECKKEDGAAGTVYTCYLVYENYFAHASAFEPKKDPDAVEGTDKDAESVLAPSLQLSQAMAAQYLILQKAPTSAGTPTSEATSPSSVENS